MSQFSSPMVDPFSGMENVEQIAQNLNLQDQQAFQADQASKDRGNALAIQTSSQNQQREMQKQQLAAQLKLMEAEDEYNAISREDMQQNAAEQAQIERDAVAAENEKQRQNAMAVAESQNKAALERDLTLAKMREEAAVRAAEAKQRWLRATGPEREQALRDQLKAQNQLADLRTQSAEEVKQVEAYNGQFQAQREKVRSTAETQALALTQQGKNMYQGGTRAFAGALASIYARTKDPRDLEGLISSERYGNMTPEQKLQYQKKVGIDPSKNVYADAAMQIGAEVAKELPGVSQSDVMEIFRQAYVLSEMPSATPGDAQMRDRAIGTIKQMVDKVVNESGGRVDHYQLQEAIDGVLDGMEAANDAGKLQALIGNSETVTPDLKEAVLGVSGKEAAKKMSSQFRQSLSKVGQGLRQSLTSEMQDYWGENVVSPELITEFATREVAKAAHFDPNVPPPVKAIYQSKAVLASLSRRLGSDLAYLRRLGEQTQESKASMQKLRQQIEHVQDAMAELEVMELKNTDKWSLELDPREFAIFGGELPGVMGGKPDAAPVR